MEQIQELLCLAGMCKQPIHALQYLVYEPEDGMQLRSNAEMVSNILMAGFCAEDVHDLGLRLQIFLQTLARGAQIHIWKTGEN